ncbi:uncharacterized protein HMPREF1541_06220 [Cyphellophora europaea CBS 101466]|uniref:Enoyl reductase (ER) domain-containing protein n=1 Tax=Cyphellophora europaea (strain CBS 101466) TaxID=1220924 RepID=W2RR29_CYPE1|nr:uncharacterized protein HMPREF1541_06220 [Cyphellophora europaea CBS 101466]ETN38189.1 hypothetical protein HMPREF1541_06220 [Cyphellophora europaea CBS 101466]
MTPTNNAAFLTEKQSLEFIIQNAPYTAPQQGELVIRTQAVAVNPADYGIQALGILLTDYPAILGCDVAGEVVEVGVGPWSPGDLVFGAATPLLQRPPGTYSSAGFQEYIVLRAPHVARVPPHLAPKDAAVLPLGTLTATACLFTPTLLDLSLPQDPAGSKSPPNQATSIDTSTNTHKLLLVWGASSSVGACGVQLAAQAGYHVVGVASTRNHDMVRACGAHAVFDHSATDIVEQLLSYLSQHAELKVVGALDAISTAHTIGPLCEVLARCGTGDTSMPVRRFIASVVPGAEAFAKRGVAVVTGMSTEVDEARSRRLWAWIEGAVADGRYKCLPRAEVVGQSGLVDVQEGVRRMGVGVSAAKLVVTF